MIQLTNDVIESNYRKLLDIVNLFGDRTPNLHKMYSDFEDTIKYAPASSDINFHNAFDGGYVDHVLRVFEFSFNVYEMWKGVGVKVDNFSIEELGFVALHHDLGKLGFPGKANARYIPQTSDWHYKQGKVYSINENIPFTLVQHQSLFLLQEYGVKMTFSEFYGILIHDGMYDELNKPYFISKTKNIDFVNYLPNIVHTADLMASKYEFHNYHSNK